MSTQARAEVTAQAPGRVNLIGEHTDYNDGFVLPAPIPQQTRVRLTARDDREVHVQSRQQASHGSFTLGDESVRRDWLDYIQGVTQALRKAGHALSGFDAELTSNLPMGAGLSSSAALEVALLRGLRKLFALQISDQDIAKIGRAAEVDFVGVPIGIMDQMASSLGTQGRALLIDTRTLETRDVPIPEPLELAVIASGVVHAHDTGEYKQRRHECERAAAALGVAALRDVNLEQLERRVGLDSLLYKRARHVISENARVLETVDALASCDTDSLRRLFAESHASMRDDYQVSVPAIDLLVELAGSAEGVVAARLTGGGFGGSIVMLAERGEGRAAARAICDAYSTRTGLTPEILLPLE